MQVKNIEIKQIDTLMRKVNNAYPRISPYRVSMQLAGKEVDFKHKVWVNKLGGIVDSNRRKCQDWRLFNLIINDTNNVKKDRLGDCGESALLMMGSLISKGIKDSKIARLVFCAEAVDLDTGEKIGEKIFDTTHELVVKNMNDRADFSNPKTYGKDLVVIDAWAGFCTNMQEAFNKYYELFWGGMREFLYPEERIKIKYRPEFHTINTNYNISPEEVEKLKELFSELK